MTIPEDLHLNAAEKQVLSKGLTFVPSNCTTDIYEIHRDYQSFARRARLKYHFAASNSAAGLEVGKVHTKEKSIYDLVNPRGSKWAPPKGQNAALEYLIEEGRRLLPLKPRDVPLNVSASEIAALRQLQQREDVVIKPADKGGAIVVWRKDLYIQEAMRQLADQTNYRRIKDDPTQLYQQEVQSTIEQFCASGTLEKEAFRLLVDKPRCSRFYLLPKIHKLGNPGRPIVSACSCPTMHISAYVDIVLQPLVKETRAFLKDTTDFLVAIQDVSYSGTNTFMATGDVASLYTVIPHDDGLEALRYFLDRRKVKDPPTNVVIRLAELVLTLNAFEFNGEYFQQVSGVAMGTKMGPSYADLFMAYLEEKLFAPKDLVFPYVYRRFRDDIFIFSSSHESAALQPFINGLNSMHYRIKIEFNIGNELPFLDTLVSIRGGKLNTSIYYKPTDSHSYLLYTSHHPKATKDAIPYSQFLRLRRICSDDGDFKRQCLTMKEFLLGKLYPSNLVDRAMNKVFLITREQSLRQVKKDNDKILPFVMTFGETAKGVIQQIRKLYESIVPHDPELKDVLPAAPLAAYRRPKNLRDLLVRASLKKQGRNPRQVHANPGSVPCNSKKCLTCKHVILTNEVKGPHGSQKILDQFNCKSRCVIYAITCAKCSAVYIGQTQRRLHERFREHLYGLGRDPATAVSEHFTKLHSREDMRITAIQQAPLDLEKRLETEARIIFKLGTHLTPGLNTDFKFI